MTRNEFESELRRLLREHGERTGNQRCVECTGCELCLPPCPVDCIVLAPRPWRSAEIIPGSRRAEADRARRRFEQRNTRLERERREHAERMAAKAARRGDSVRADANGSQARKRAIVEAALQRARAKLADSG